MNRGQGNPFLLGALRCLQIKFTGILFGGVAFFLYCFLFALSSSFVNY